jgi:agmatinase
MRAESQYGMESYSPYQEKDLYDLNICDGGDLELPFGNALKAVKTVEKMTAKILRDDKLPLMIGGEHLLTLGGAKAAYEKYPDLCVVHFDAHADVREEILGERLSHGTVMRRIWEFTGDGSIFQFGIRSGMKEEFEFCARHINTVKFTFDGIEKLAGKIKGRPVYFSIDVDVLDPSEMPGTGTPEAGGVSFKELLEAIMTVCKSNVVAADLMEVSPVCDASGRSVTCACKILREFLIALNNK